MSAARRIGFAVFALVSGALTLWIGAELSGYERDSGRDSHHATFGDATNLRVGDPVRVSGVRVGKVTSVRVVAGEAAVEFEISKDVALPVDSSVSVRSQNLIGLRELVVEPGEDEALLDDGDEVAITASAVDLGALINELGPLLETVAPDKLNSVIEALNQTVDGRRETIQSVTGDLTVVLDSLANRSGTIGQLVDDYGTLTGELSRRDQQIQRLLDNLLLLTDTFDASEGTLVRALEELPAFSGKLDSLLTANAGNLDSLLADLAVLTGQVRGNLQTVDAAVRGLPDSVSGLYGVANQGELLVTNFLCISTGGPPCPTPLTDGGPSLADILGQLMAP